MTELSDEQAEIIDTIQHLKHLLRKLDEKPGWIQRMIKDLQD